MKNMIIIDSVGFKVLSVWLFVLLFFPCLRLPAAALEYPGFDPTLRSGDPKKPLFEEDQAEKPEPEIKSPAPPDTEAPPERQVSLGPNVQILVRQIRTVGNQTCSDAELAAITHPFLNRRLTYEDLERIRRQLTLFYIQKGYVNSGAVLPDQEVTDGVVTFLIVEGRLSEINVTGNRRLRDGYYQSRIGTAAGPPVNIRTLEEQLRILQQQTMIKRLHAELKPGIEPGQSIMDLAVEERSPFDAQLIFNNYQSPSVGAERGLLSLTHRSLTGIGDTLSFTYGRSQGLNPLLDVAYRLPFTARDTEFGFRYRMNDFDIVEEPFQDLDIESKSEIFELKLRQPFCRTPNREFAVGLIGERLHSRSWLLGEPFSFSDGTVDGEATVVALRFFQEYLYRSRQHVVAAHSRFSVGLDAFDATTHGNGDPDGRFFAWLGQFQWASLSEPLGIQTILRTDIQLADDPLLALEQISVGGRYSVRGYRENQLVRDNGVIASIETRIPLIRDAAWADYLQLAPFFDFGHAWYSESSTPGPKNLSSVGVGLRWALTLLTNPLPTTANLEVYWGHALRHVDASNYNLQDDGIHFQFMISAF